MRRTFIIIAVVIVLAGVGAGVYFYFFGNAPSVTVAPTESSGLPVAERGALPGAEQTTTSYSPTGTPVVVSPRLVQITTGPVVPGESVVDIKAANASPVGNQISNGASSSPDAAVSYIARESGNVFSYLTKTRVLTRTSNRTLPGIQSAVWLPNASTTFVRYLSDERFSTINTYALPASGTGGFFLPQNLADIAVSSTRILTLASGVSGSVASLSNTDGTHTSTLFTSPLSALRVSFAGENQSLAFTKPTMTLAGLAFLVDSAGNFSRIAGPRNGLVALASPLGKWVLVSYANGGAMYMELINTANGEALPLPVATIADKCVWAATDSSVYCGIPISPSTAYNYPDDWYQGVIRFSDRIWKIDVAGRYAQLVLDFSQETEAPLDAEALAINPAGTVLVFMNKNDGSLWSYSL